MPAAALFHKVPYKIPPGVMIAWPSTAASIPSGWTRETAYDGIFVKMIATSGTNPGAIGGATSHDHPYGSHSDHGFAHSHATWSVASSSTSGAFSACNKNYSGHTHVVTQAGTSLNSQGSGGPANFTATTTDPQYLEVIFIKSGGSAFGIPNSALAYFNAAAPSGWGQYASGNNRMLKGAAAAGNGGATGGTGNSHTHPSATHTHTYGEHTHALSIASGTPGANNSVSASPSGPNADAGHTHAGHNATDSSGASGTSGSSSESSNSGDMTPTWAKSLLIQNTSGLPSLPTNVICMWDGTLATIPYRWKLCDGTSGTPNLSNGRFAMNSDTTGNIGTTGGGSTHTHTGVGHSHTTAGTAHIHAQSTGSSATAPNSPLHSLNSAAGQITPTHAHNQGHASSSDALSCLVSRSTTATANTSNDPSYKAVSYIQYTG